MRSKNEMASIRCVELEGSDETVLDAIRSFMGRGNGFVTTTPVERKSLAPVEAVERKAIEATAGELRSPGKLKHAPPKTRRKVGKRAARIASPADLPAHSGKMEPTHGTRRTMPGPGAPGPLGRTVDAADANADEAAKAGKKSGCRELVHEALQHGSMTSGELLNRLQKYTPSSIYLALKELRAQGTVKTHEIDGEMQNELVA